MNHFVPVDIIAKRKKGLDHSREELQYLVDQFVAGTLPEYQMSAWLMANYIHPLSRQNTSELTQIMKNSGDVIDFDGTFVLDKHSTGGVGDKTTMIVVPIVAACGLPVASIAGRGLGHTGGTLDKLESIAGYDIFRSTESFVSQVKSLGASIIGQTQNICPADKKLYALRDVTHTVDCLPLIAASIMSKKLAEGISGLVLDVKWGTGAFMEEFEQALELAEWLKAIGENNGVKTHALITDMNQPLGRFAGNSLEIKECVEILENKTLEENGFDFYSPTRELSLQLASHMLFIGKKCGSIQEGYELASQVLNEGRALELFKKMAAAQGAEDVFNFKISEYKHEIVAPSEGTLHSMNTKELGMACVQLKAGRVKSEDLIDPSTGIETHVRLGESLKKGQPLFTVYHDNKTPLEDINKRILNSLNFGDRAQETHPLVRKVLQ